MIEAEVTNPGPPELEAQAPGPHILEIGTIEDRLEMYSPKPVGELEGWLRSIPELEGRSD